jgi:hypothetical protein
VRYGRERERKIRKTGVAGREREEIDKWGRERE